MNGINDLISNDKKVMTKGLSVDWTAVRFKQSKTRVIITVEL